nr:immunoglobulin light chain junction region [Homo sapiens]
TVTLRLTTI